MGKKPNEPVFEPESLPILSIFKLNRKTFAEAWRFMNLIAQHAEAQDHHPNWYNVYGTVQIRLSSHDADGVTERDFRLASSIDQILTDFDYTDLTPTPIFKD